MKNNKIVVITVWVVVCITFVLFIYQLKAEPKAETNENASKKEFSDIKTTPVIEIVEQNEKSTPQETSSDKSREVPKCCDEDK